MFKLSIIIPVFNRPFLLEHTLNSLKNINKNNNEIIVIDDGSSKANSIIQKKAAIKHGAVYFYQKNRGLAYARNKGVAISSGKFLFFLDSDDNMTEKFVAFINEKYHIWSKYDVSKYWNKIVGIKQYSDKTFFPNKFLTKTEKFYSISASSYIIKKSFFLNNNLHFINIHSEDWLFSIKLYEVINIKKIRVFKLFSILYQKSLNTLSTSDWDKNRYNEFKNKLKNVKLSPEKKDFLFIHVIYTLIKNKNIINMNIIADFYKKIILIWKNQKKAIMKFSPLYWKIRFKYIYKNAKIFYLNL